MEEVCVIENENHTKVSVIYQIDKQIYICTILPQFDTKNAGKFVNEACTYFVSCDVHLSISCILIFNLRNIYLCLYLQISDLLLKSKSTISIMCRHISQFQSTSVPDTASFLRILFSKTANITKCEIKPLEQPNIVFGVGAGG